MAKCLLLQVLGCHPITLCHVDNSPSYIRPTFSSSAFLKIFRPIESSPSLSIIQTCTKEGSKAVRRGTQSSQVVINGGSDTFCLQGDCAIQEWKPGALHRMVPWVTFGFVHEAPRRLRTLPGIGPPVLPPRPLRPLHGGITFKRTQLQQPGSRIIWGPVSSLPTDHSTCDCMISNRQKPS